jgi:lipopolysaccharide export system protein LptA
MIRHLLAIVGVVLFWCGIASGAQLAAGLAADAPISISAERLEANDSIREVRFVGNVVARQGDLAIYANELVLHYPAESREIDRVEARGDVRIVQGNRVATGQSAAFFNRERKIVLSGSPRVYQGEDFVEGDEITVLLDEEKSIVKSDQGSRVNAVFHPKGERQ